MYIGLVTIPLTKNSSKMSRPLDHSSNKVSFSWEKKPGVSKVTTHGETLPREHEPLAKLPPPPCTQQEAANTTRNHVHDFQNIPLPPCAFQPPYYRTSSKKGLWVQDDDPFLAAYKECTKNQKSGGGRTKKLAKAGIESRLRKGLSCFSCKRSCSVHGNNSVRISSLPHNID